MNILLLSIAVLIVKALIGALAMVGFLFLATWRVD